MPVILPDHRLGVQLPQPRVVVRAGCHQIGAIGAERAVPHPSLVGFQRGFEGKSARLALGGEVFVALDVVGCGGVDGPDSSVVVGGAGGEVAHVGAN